MEDKPIVNRSDTDSSSGDNDEQGEKGVTDRKEAGLYKGKINQLTVNTETVEWNSAEYIHHPKGPMWSLGIFVIAVAFLILAVWLRAWTFAALIVVMAVAFWVVAFRSPKVLHYKLNKRGIEVDGVFFGLDRFRAYGLLQDGDLYTLMLIPTKRFMPPMTVFFKEENGEKIIDVLGAYLPAEQIEEGVIERVMRYLRF